MNMMMSTWNPPPGPSLAALSIPPDPPPSAIRAGRQVVWEYRGDPDPQSRLEASRRLRRKGWLWVLAIMLAVGIAPVIAYGAWGLFYPGLVLVIRPARRRVWLIMVGLLLLLVLSTTFRVLQDGF
jgi:hypothetical protein